MNDNGTFKIVNGKQEHPTWDITLLDNEITLFSNGFYLGYDEKSNKIVSDKYMRRWNYEIKNESYIIKTSNNLFLSLKGNKLNLEDNNNNYSIFQLIDKN